MSDSSTIMELLARTDPESIREGARMAGDERLEEALPSLVGHLSSANIGVQEAADRALRKIGGAKVVHAVIPLLRSDDAPERNIAMDILRQLGHSDLKILAELLHDDDADIRIFISDILGSTGDEMAVPLLCAALLHDPEVNVRYQAAVSLGTLAFPSAAQCLNKALEDEEWVQFSVIEALTKIRVDSSVGAMMKALEKSSDLIASTIVDALGEMGNIKAVPMLLKRLSDSPAALCNKIVKAIVNILGEGSLSLLGGKDQKRLTEYMEAALKDEDEDVQDAAVRGLAAFGGERASRDILRLAGSLDADRDGERIAFMTEAVSKVGFNAVVAEVIRDGSESEQHVALGAVRLVQDPAVAPLLMEVFWKKPRDVQRLIMTILCEQACSTCQQFFLDVLEQHDDGTIIRAALQFLGGHGDPARAETPVLTMLGHPYNDVKESALGAAIALGTPTIREHFRKLASDTSLINRIMGVYALGQFGADEYLKELAVAVKDQSEDVRKVATEALGVQKPLPPERLALVEEMLSDMSREVRMAAVDVLGDLPDEHIESLLVERLSDEDPWVRVRSVEKLGNRKSLKATEALIETLRDDNNLVVLRAISSLGKIGGELAFRSLLGLLEHPDEEVQQHAESAVEAIRNQSGE